MVDAQLPPTPTPPQFAPAAPPQPQVVPDAVLSALHAAVPVPTVRLDTPDPSLKVMTRRLNDAGVSLFFNEGAQPCDREVTLASHGKIVQRWDPQTASIQPVKATRKGREVAAHLHLQAYETQVIVLR